MRVAPGHICVAEKNEKNESRTRNQKKKKNQSKIDETSREGKKV